MANPFSQINPLGITIGSDGTPSYADPALSDATSQFREVVKPDLAPNQPSCTNPADCGSNTAVCSNPGNCTGQNNTWLCNNKSSCGGGTNKLQCTDGYCGQCPGG